MNEYRKDLPPLPEKLANCAIDDRGYPVPWFVAYIDGKPDHRVIDARKFEPAIEKGLCWQCGNPLGGLKAAAIGPMCAITRTISEPPSHRECLQFAVRACPFLSRPHARRRGDLPEGSQDAAGNGLKRNPGVICIWTTQTAHPWQQPGGGWLWRLEDPYETEWFAEGRKATRAEVDHSIDTGLVHLFEMADRQDIEEGNSDRQARLELESRIRRERRRLDRLVWP